MRPERMAGEDAAAPRPAAPRGRPGPAAALSGAARRGLDAAAGWAHWLTRVMPRDPLREIYIARQGMLNHRHHLAGVAERTAAERGGAAAAWTRPEIPRTIWTYWAQGEAGMPAVARRCVDSWRERNPGWTYRVLDAGTVGDFVDSAHVPAHLPFRFRTNVVKLGLMRLHGGVWADATCYCHRPLDDWLPHAAASGFFVFRDPGPSRWMDNWFIAAAAGDPLAAAWSEEYDRYVVGATDRHRAYFAMIYVFQWRMLRDPALREAWGRMTTVPAPACLLLARSLVGRVPFEAAVDAVRAGLPVSKLTWKGKVDLDLLQRRIEALEQVGS